ncbi:quinolinate synthase NadA [Mesorhizobium sp. M0207]|uniref:quinolinate synthase NadA n=1 Tax=Mesorhizobium sp. M0207 TaxID=2956915 RepID=UPI003336DCD2
MADVRGRYRRHSRSERQRNAVILAHNCQTPEIFHCVADIVGESLALALMAMTVEADVLVLAGVHHGRDGEAAQPGQNSAHSRSARAGCSPADSITAEDVRPAATAVSGIPIVTYVNISAAVTAESDICCTSGNAKAVVETLSVPRSRRRPIPPSVMVQGPLSICDREVRRPGNHSRVSLQADAG